jgi:hypothetical protein
MYQNEKKIIYYLDGSSKFSGINFTYPCTPSQLNPTVIIGRQIQMGSSQGCNMSEQPEQSDNLDEHVGFNKEGMYGSDVEVDFSNDISNHAIDLEEGNELEEPIVDDVEGNVHEELKINDVVQCEPSLVFNSENHQNKG